MNIIRLSTLVKKETLRFFKVWTQTILSPVMVAILYFAVFGGALSSRITEISGISYLAFIVPGLMMLQSTNNAFQNPSSSLTISKYHGTIADLMTAPLSALEKALGYILGGVVRGILVAIAILITAFPFVDHIFPIHPFWALFFLVLANASFAALGTIVGLWAKTFDHTAGISTFLITPMGFLGGVFYSVTMLPPLAQTLSLWNPFLYFVDALRWAFFNTGDIPIFIDGLVLGGVTLFLCLLTIFLFAKNWKLQE
ncbi:MAG: ABC transporter permease [Candidatus Peregrinibacteria bacterium]